MAVPGPAHRNPKGRLAHRPGASTLTLVHRHATAPEAMAVFVGGALGTAARLGLDRWLPHESHELPVSTLIVNLTGSFLLGLLLSTAHRRVGGHVRLALTTGFLGTFTTLSAVALSTVLLVDGGRTGLAATYVAVTVLTGLGAAWAGSATGRRLDRGADA